MVDDKAQGTPVPSRCVRRRPDTRTACALCGRARATSRCAAGGPLVPRARRVAVPLRQTGVRPASPARGAKPRRLHAKRFRELGAGSCRVAARSRAGRACAEVSLFVVNNNRTISRAPYGRRPKPAANRESVFRGLIALIALSPRLASLGLWQSAHHWGSRS